jgi:hypothetical protein
MINHIHKFIFIHVPKCAGTAIEEKLFAGVDKCIHPKSDDQIRNAREYLFGLDNPPTRWLQHLKYNEIVNCEYVGTDIKDYFKFAIVRNPWSKKVSEYFWNFKQEKIDIPFKKFVKMEWKPHESYCHGDPQYSFTHDSSGNNKMDFIGRVENLQEDFNTICDKIGIPQQQLSHKNKSKHVHYTKYYDDETRQIVAEKYAKDIEYFGYEFGS